MKKFLKNDIYILLSLLFLVLLFKENTLFKNCILEGCSCFFKQVFPALFPMFILNDILLSYNFISYLNRWCQKLFYKLFHFSSAATYIFILSIFSGTPTNGYIATNFVKNGQLTKEDASIILSYSCFLNPLFLFSMLNSITNNEKETLKCLFVYYSINCFLAFCKRKYPYQTTNIEYQIPKKPFSTILSESINHAFQTLLLILGTMIIYFVICEGIHLFFQNEIINCLLNGLLEVTGGLSKIQNLSINMQAKNTIALAFISFGGFSIHSQIKSIIEDANISYKPFFKARILSMLLTTAIYVITS